MAEHAGAAAQVADVPGPSGPAPSMAWTIMRVVAWWPVPKAMRGVMIDLVREAGPGLVEVRPDADLASPISIGWKLLSHSAFQLRGLDLAHGDR